MQPGSVLLPLPTPPVICNLPNPSFIYTLPFYVWLFLSLLSLLSSPSSLYLLWPRWMTQWIMSWGLGKSLGCLWLVIRLSRPSSRITPGRALDPSPGRCASGTGLTDPGSSPTGCTAWGTAAAKVDPGSEVLWLWPFSNLTSCCRLKLAGGSAEDFVLLL